MRSVEDPRADRADEQGTEGEKDSGETHGGNEVVSEDRRRMTVEETVMGWREAGSLSRGGQIDGSTIPLSIFVISILSPCKR